MPDKNHQEEAAVLLQNIDGPCDLNSPAGIYPAFELSQHACHDLAASASAASPHNQELNNSSSRGDVSVEDCRSSETACSMDDVLRSYTPFSFYQKQLVLVCAVVVLAGAPQAAILVFIGDRPVWSCQQQDQHEYNVTSSGGHGASANRGIDASQTATAALSAERDGLSEEQRCALVRRRKCTPLYVNVHAKASAEFNLICEKSSEANYAQSSFFVGMLLGSCLTGWLSDKYGRRTAVLVAQCVSLLASLWTWQSTSFLSFTASRCLSGVGLQILIAPLFVLVSESVAPDYRAFVTTLPSCVFGLGFTLLAPLAYLTRHSWRSLMAVCTGSVLVGLFCSWLWATESPYWLLHNGRHDRVKATISRWARSSSRPIPDSVLASLTVPREKDSSSSSSSPSPVGGAEATSLLPFLSKGLRHLTLTLFCAWFTTCLVYYGLALNTHGVGSNKYISFFILSAIEIPALIGVVIILRYAGRRPTMFWSTLVTGIVVSLSAFIAWLNSVPSTATSAELAENGESTMPVSTSHASLENAQLAIVMCGKFSTAAAFSVVYTYTPELLPTAIRTSGLGMCVTVSRFGAIVSPFVINLFNTTPPLHTICNPILSDMYGYALVAGD
ncbi:solute carrier family 22 member 7-like isoform X2 [Sycon ciliatum]|uniref:solute carrier family 22 member 7-like isoform X2 n=1 Tax=Sycon ciliatum TaxID=27933 RepID=UPI0031F6A8BD